MKRFVLGAVVGLALASGVAYATIPDSGGVIHACMLKNIGTIRVIDPSQGQKCSTSLETPIDWNQKGSAGSRGPTGPAGPNGTAGAGTRGPTGADGAKGATGPRGPSGQSGAQGSKGDPGPPGPAGPPGVSGSGGGALASFDELEGLPCTNGSQQGAIDISYATTGAATLTCATNTHVLSVSLVGDTGGAKVTSFPPGISCLNGLSGPTGCAHSYANGTQVTLSPPTLGQNEMFTGWTGDCTGTGNCVVTMNAAKNVVAHIAFYAFLDMAMQRGTSLGTGVSCTGTPSVCTPNGILAGTGGISCGPFTDDGFTGPELAIGCDNGTGNYPGYSKFPIGTSVTLTVGQAPSGVSIGTVEWGGACSTATGTSCTLALTTTPGGTTTASVRLK